MSLKDRDSKDIQKSEDALPLIEGEDFYVENGFYVFTAKYLLKRGYCCGSGCRHCPYKRSENSGSEL